MKKNGFSCPTNFTQIISWILFIFINIKYFIITKKVINTNYHVSITITVIHSIIATLLFFALIITTISDPCDPFVLIEIEKKHNCKKNNIEYNLEINKNQDFCILCSSNIKSSSKHCKNCNKCIDIFDHHCSWLNNCIGRINYKWFLVLLLVIFIFCLFNITVVCYFSNIGINQYHNYKNSNNNIPENFDIKETYSYCIISLSLLIVEAIAIINIIYLIIVHIWLNYKGLSTYDFIIQKQNYVEKNNKSINYSKTKDLSNININHNKDEDSIIKLNKLNKNASKNHIKLVTCNNYIIGENKRISNSNIIEISNNTNKENGLIKDNIFAIKSHKANLELSLNSLNIEKLNKRNQIMPSKLIDKMESNKYIDLKDKIIITNINFQKEVLNPLVNKIYENKNK